MAEPIKRGNKILGVLLLMTQPGEIDDVLWDERWLILQIAAIALLARDLVSSLLVARQSPDPCAGFRKPPITSARTSPRARNCPTSPSAATRSGRWAAPSSP